MRSLKSLAAVAGLVAAGALVPSVAAQAAPTQTTLTTAAQPCPADNLCLYGSTGFNNMKFRTARHGYCWWLGNYGLQNAVLSYDNNLGAEVYFTNGSSASPTGQVVWSSRVGGSSSNSGAFSGENWVCTN